MSKMENLAPDDETASEEGLPRPRPSWRRTVLRLGVSGLTLAALIMILPRGDLWAALRQVPLVAWLAGVAIYLSLQVLGVVKWRLTVNLTGAGLGFAQAARCYYGGLFSNVFLPSIIGGDVVRAGLAFGRTRSRTGLVLGCLLDRLIDFTALATVASLGALLLRDRFAMLGRNVLLPLAVAFVTAVVVLAALWVLIPVGRLPPRVRLLREKLQQAARPVAQRPHYVLASLAIAVTLQSCLVMLNAWLGRACGLDCPLAVWFFVWPLAKLSAVLPVSQGGVGVREAALAFFFKMFSVSAPLAVAAGLVFEAVIIMGHLISGPIAVALGYLSVSPEITAPVASQGIRREPCKTI